MSWNRVLLSPKLHIGFASAVTLVALFGYLIAERSGYTSYAGYNMLENRWSESEALSGDSVDSGLRLEVADVRKGAFFTLLDLTIEESSDPASEIVEVAPIGPEHLTATGFAELPVNSGSIGAGIRSPESDLATVQVLVGPVIRESATQGLSIKSLTVLFEDQSESTTVTGNWDLDLPNLSPDNRDSFEEIPLGETFRSNGNEILVESLLASHSEIAVVYSSELDDGTLPIGHEITLLTDVGETIYGQSVPAPRKSAQDTRMKVFSVPTDDLTDVEVVPGRFVKTEKKDLEVTFPLPSEMLGPADETVSLDVDIQVDTNGVQTHVFGFQSARIGENHAFLIAATSHGHGHDPIYLVAPERDNIKARDDLGNEYLYAGGSFGEGWTDLQFEGPIDQGASELTIVVNRVGTEFEFDQSIGVNLNSSDSVPTP